MCRLRGWERSGPDRLQQAKAPAQQWEPEKVGGAHGLGGTGTGIAPSQCGSNDVVPSPWRPCTLPSLYPPPTRTAAVVCLSPLAPTGLLTPALHLLTSYHLILTADLGPGTRGLELHVTPIHLSPQSSRTTAILMPHASDLGREGRLVVSSKALTCIRCSNPTTGGYTGKQQIMS